MGSILFTPRNLYFYHTNGTRMQSVAAGRASPYSIGSLKYSPRPLAIRKLARKREKTESVEE